MPGGSLYLAGEEGEGGWLDAALHYSVMILSLHGRKLGRKVG